MVIGGFDGTGNDVVIPEDAAIEGSDWDKSDVDTLAFEFMTEDHSRQGVAQ